MGERRTSCKNCGNENVNEMIVWFIWDNGVGDATTLPKFLHYLRYPEDRQGKLEPASNPMLIKKITCSKCKTEITPTRFGV